MRSLHHLFMQIVSAIALVSLFVSLHPFDIASAGILPALNSQVTPSDRIFNGTQTAAENEPKQTVVPVGPASREIESKTGDHRKVALVVGNAEYAANVGQLENPTADARAMAALLEDLGFDVILGINLTFLDMYDTFRRFSQRLTGADLGLFFYSGHGFENGGVNYIVPVDAALSEASDIALVGLPVDKLLSVMETSVPTRVLLLDACRNNLSFTTRDVSSTARRGFGLVPITASNVGTFISYATAPGQVAMDGPGNHSLFTAALLAHLKSPGVEIEQVFREVRRAVIEETGGRQVPWTLSSLVTPLYFYPLPDIPDPLQNAPNVATVARVAVDAALQKTFSGREPRISDRKLTMSGGSLSITPDEAKGVLRNGLNTLFVAGQTVRAWYEEQKLSAFEEPYKQSYAIIAAIDEYGGVKRTGYPDLGKMVDGAKALGERLTKLGFPREHIFPLFNQDATSDRLDALLREFWQGGKYQDADRLVIYFAGHGHHVATTSDESRPRGLLITYNYRDSEPARTGFLLDDLISRHFEYIKAKHVMALIDACSSGLALPKFQTKPDDRDSVSRFTRLSTLRAETAKRGRNVLVAGTVDEPALWDGGGVFTWALLTALDGAADWNHDGLLQFGELALQVRQEVAERAGKVGVKQVPDDFAIGGKMVFILPQ